jgi:cell division transport system permease protein
VVQALAALLLISNTIQLAAFNRRNETNIMRLVGASRWYTQLPFILEAALAGLIGGLLAVGGLVLTKLMFVDKTLEGPIKAGIITGIDWDQIATTGAIITAAGVGLAAVASYVTLRLYVRL